MEAPETQQSGSRPRPHVEPASPQAARASMAAARRPGGAVSPMPQAEGGGTRPFRVRFQVEAVLEAVDVRDAIRQAEARGITEITAVTRED